MLITIGIFATYFAPFGLTTGGVTLIPTFLGSVLIAASTKRGYKFTIRNSRIFFAIFLFLLVSTLITPELTSQWQEKLKSTSQLLMSVLLASFVFIEFSRVSRSKRARFYRLSLIIVLCLATIEVVVPGASIALDAVREVLYPQREALSNISRDIIAYGAARPILLTAEPSYLAYSVAVFLSLLLLASDEIRSFFALVIVATLLVRSPIVFLLPIATYTVISYEVHPVKTLKGLLVFLLAGGVLVYGWSMVSDRPLDILSGRDFSAWSRMFAPFLLMVEYFPQSVFVGAGLGGDSVLIDSAHSLFYKYGFAHRTLHMTDLSVVRQTMPSYFWQIWIFFGIIGGAIFAILIYFFIKLHVFSRNFTSYIVLPILLFAVAGLFIGRIAALMTWVTLMLIALEFNSKFSKAI